MTDDSDFPRLTPPDDRYPAPDRLLRKPEELTDEQFDLLAAAWSEETLAGDHLSELEAAMTANPSRKMRAESFRRVKLVPCNDRWPGRSRLLKQSQASVAIRRTLIITAAAAAMLTLIMLGPAVTRQITEKTTETPPGTTGMAEVLIPESQPVIIPARRMADSAGENTAQTSPEPATAMIETPEAVRAAAITEASVSVLTTAIALAPAHDFEPEISETVKSLPASATTEAASPIPVTKDQYAGTALPIAAPGSIILRPVEMNPATRAPQQESIAAEMSATEKETNWVLRGFSALAKVITREEKKIDGYFVASACVTGINNFLGWEMELEQSSNHDGEPVAVNFSSSLLSFSAPVNKNSP